MNDKYDDNNFEVNQVNLQHIDRNCVNNDLNRDNYDIYYEKCCYDGGGIELNDNHVHEMVISKDILFYDDHNVNAKTQGSAL